MVLHVITNTAPTHTPCTGSLTCTCPPCELDRQHAIAIAQAGHRDRPQPWAAIEREAA